MMFETILFGGFLFATICASQSATGTFKPKMATLELLPNFDQGLTYRDFRVHYSGVEGTTSSPVYIKIYKDEESTELVKFEVDLNEITTPKAYYFGLDSAAAGEYKVDVCADTVCSGKNSALTKLPNNPQKDKITCEMGHEDAESEQYVKDEEVKFDVIGSEGWISSSDIQAMPEMIKQKTEWVKYGIESSPSYDASAQRLYTGVMFDLAYYRKIFMKKDAPGRQAHEQFAPDYCKRKYLLSYHVHVLNKQTHQVIHRAKRTLHMSQEGKLYFIYNNPGEKAQRRKVHVEMTSENLTLDANQSYQVWVSFCATEKDVNESTVCSDPEVADLNLTSSA